MASSTLNPKLYQAARMGNIEVFKYVLHDAKLNIVLDAFNANPNDDCQSEPGPEPADNPLSRVNFAGDTVLHIASHFSHTDLAKRICQASKPLLMAVNDKHETPLHYAAQTGNTELVGYFIKIANNEGNQINLLELLQKQDIEGETALYQAVYHKHEEVVKELMKADPKSPGLATPASNQCISPLYLATMLESLEMVTCLLPYLPSNQRGAYIGPDGQNALHIAALSKDKGALFVDKIVRWKQELARETDYSGYTPLHYAASVNNCTVAKMICNWDMRLAYTSNSSGLLPIHVAAISGHLDVLDELLEGCPDTARLLDRQGRNFLHLAVEAKRVRVVQWACGNRKLEKEIFQAKDDQGNTLLHLAVKTKDPAVVWHLLLSREFRDEHLTWMNKNWLTPLDIAIEQMKGSPTVQDPKIVIYDTLMGIGCRKKITPAIPFELDVGQQYDKEKETKREMEKSNHLTLDVGQQNDKEKEINREMEKVIRSILDVEQQNDKEKEIKREMEACESMAKSMSIGSVLIASATSAAAFTLYGIYSKHREYYIRSNLDVVFQVFFVMDIFAFLCAIIATGLLVEASLAFIELEQRKKHLMHCTSLVLITAKWFVTAFTIAAYFILNPVRKGLAIVIYCVGTIAPFLIQPRPWPNELVFKILVEYKLKKGLLGLEALPRVVPLLGNVIYLLVMICVLLSNLTPANACNNHCCPFDCARHYGPLDCARHNDCCPFDCACHYNPFDSEFVRWALVVAYLVVIFWDLLRSILQPGKSVRTMIRAAGF